MAKRRATDPLEEENQNPNMSPISLSSRSEAPEAIIQEGPLFDPINYTSLIQIVNQLDPSSFVKFSRTCKDLHGFCYNAKGIQVQFHCKIYSGPSEVRFEKPGPDGGAISEQERQKLLKMPFTVVVNDIFFLPAEARDLEEVRQLLRRFDRVIVEFVSVCRAADWNDLIEFLQNHNVKRMQTQWLRNSAIPVDLLPFFLTKMDCFNHEERVADDLILTATAKELRLPCAKISKYTFMDLLQKFANEDVVDWMFGREQHDDEGEESDPFIDVCAKMMKIVNVEKLDWKNMEPGVLYSRFRNPKLFYLRKSDGSFGKFKITQYFVFFTGIRVRL